MDQFKYLTLYTGSDAKTHFKEDYLPWQPIREPITESPHTSIRIIKNEIPHLPLQLPRPM
jgi:hypothetical protein